MFKKIKFKILQIIICMLEKKTGSKVFSISPLSTKKFTCKSGAVLVSSSLNEIITITICDNVLNVTDCSYE